MTGREALHYVRTLSPVAVQALLKDRSTPATLRTVCQWSQGAARDWNDVLQAAGITPLRAPLLGVVHRPVAKAPRKRLALAALLLLCLPSLAAAQPLVGYELRVYAVGASSPISTTAFTGAEVTCNQIAPANTTGAVNPTRAIWDDPVMPGRVCLWVSNGGVLVSLPIGTYEGAIVAIDAAGVGAESNRAPFSKQPVQAARTGFRFTRLAP